MTALLLATFTIIATVLGGLLALRFTDRLHRLLGFTAGVLLGLVAFDLLPEIFAAIEPLDMSPVWPMLALLIGFLGFHAIERSILIHHAQEGEYERHEHPQVGVASALALIGHSFLDGVGIGLSFQVNAGMGVAVTIALMAHRFTDGLNTVNLMLVTKNTSRRALLFLGLSAVAPILGAISTLLFTLPDAGLVLYLGFFAGFLLYISSSEILPEAHSKHSSYSTIALTVLGAAFIFVVTRFIEG